MDKALEARREAYDAFEHIPQKLQARAVEMARHAQTAYDNGQFETAASGWRQMARLAPATNPGSRMSRLVRVGSGEWETEDMKYGTFRNASGAWVVSGPGIPTNKVVFDLKTAKIIIQEAQKAEPFTSKNPRKEAPPQGNPRWTKIYQHCLKIYASKEGMPHQCDDKCAAANHNYVHKFTHDNSMIFGMPGDSRSNGYKYLLIINKD